MAKRIDLTGKKFNRLTAISKGNNKGKRTTWNCKCECGNIINVATKDLKSGNTQSCGCLNQEKRLVTNKTHGMSNTAMYDVWCGIKQRCYYKKHVGYKNYGAKGINMSDEWLDFEVFYEDMVDGYKEGLTIERIDNSKGYSKHNCKWATYQEQANNKHSNLMFTVENETDTLANICRKYNKNYSYVYSRLTRGKTIAESLFD